MKKAIKITIIILAVLILALITIPIVFKGPILKVVKEQINNNINAKVEFTDFNLSLIKGFPNIYISLEDLIVVGINKFEGDTLLSLKEFSVKADLLSALQKEIVIKSIIFDDLSLYAKVLADSSANWDIVKVDTSSVDPPAEDSMSSASNAISVKLKKFEINNASIRYEDISSDMQASLENLNFSLSGNLAADITTLTTILSIDKIDFTMGGVKMLNKAVLKTTADIEADMVNSKYTLKENEIALNEIVLSIIGFVQMNPKDMYMDLKLNTEKIDFKSILSLIPAVYMKDFAGLQTTGKIQLDAFAKGTYLDTIHPKAGLKLIVENASFKYPSLPKSASDININIDAFYNGIHKDSTTLDVNKFHVNLGGNTIDLMMNLVTPISDPAIKAKLLSNINFSTLNDVIPLPETSISGILNADVSIDGKMSTIEQERYEEFNALGHIILAGFKYNSPDLPKPIAINSMKMEFSPRYVDLSTLDMKIGQSDIQLNGKLENFIPYIFNNDTIKGSLVYSSTLLNLNELMPQSTEQPSEAVSDSATSPLTIIEVPGNIDFVLNSTINKLFYDKIEIDRLNGEILVKNSTLTMNDVEMYLMKGSMKMSGLYSTQNIKKPLVEFVLDMKQIDIPSAVKSLSMLEQFAPISKSCEGNFSMKFAFNSLLNDSMMPVLTSVNGKGSFSSDDIKVNGTKTLNKIAEILKNPELKTLKLQDLNIFFKIKNGRIYVEPFKTNLNGIPASISGDQGIDQTMNYNMALEIPTKLLGSDANKIVNGLLANASNKGIAVEQVNTVNVDIIVGGTVTDPKVDVKFKDIQKIGADLKDQIENKVKQEVNKAIDDAKAKASAEADRIIKQAEEQALRIKQEAKIAADKVRGEGDLQARNLIKQAGSNPLKKAAAEVASKKLKDEANTKANSIEREANTKADDILKRARNEAARLRN